MQRTCEADPRQSFCFLLRLQIDSKNDPVRQAEAREWLQAVVGEPFPEGTFQEALKDGTYLCKAIQQLNPEYKIKFNKLKTPFAMMENIGQFLNSCYNYGLEKNDVFQTVDLYDNTNIPQVVNGIHALGRKAQSMGYSGPALGPKEAKAQKREFSDGQMQEGKNIIGLQMGSNRGASQAGMTPYGASRQIH
jgi:hypothetical protein